MNSKQIIIAQCKVAGQFDVTLTREGAKYVVRYGSEVVEYGGLIRAQQGFCECVKHACMCWDGQSSL